MDREKKLIAALRECESAALTCATLCLKEEEVSMLADCIRTDLSCADFCNFTARLLLREELRAADLVNICMEVCRGCAGECEQYEHDQWIKCAEVCRKGEKECREYLESL